MSVDLGRQIEHLASQALEEKPPWTNAHHMVLPGNKTMDLIVNCRLEDFEDNEGWKDLFVFVFLDLFGCSGVLIWMFGLPYFALSMPLDSACTSMHLTAAAELFA